MADLKGECKPPRAAKLPTLGRCGGCSPRKFCNFNAPKVDFEASGIYSGSIGSHSSCTMHFVNAEMSSCSKGVGLTSINVLVCVI